MADTYLRLRNFWEYQNADAWKKAQGNKNGAQHPAWCKLHARRDYEIDVLPIVTRLVWVELLRLATVYANAIPNDSQLIANAISIDSQAVSESIERLLKGRWIQVSRSNRLSRKPSRKNLPLEKEVRSKKTPLPPLENSREPEARNGVALAPRFRCPHCGLDKGGPASLREHIENVHWEVAA